MYYHLGADLTLQQQRRLRQAQAVVARLTPIVATATAEKPMLLKKRRLTRAQAIVARLTATPTPPITSPTPPEPGTIPESSQPTPTPVWTAEPSPIPTQPTPVETAIETVSNVAQSEVAGIPVAYLAIGGILLFMLLPRRRV